MILYYTFHNKICPLLESVTGLLWYAEGYLVYRQKDKSQKNLSLVSSVHNLQVCYHTQRIIQWFDFSKPAKQ